VWVGCLDHGINNILFN